LSDREAVRIIRLIASVGPLPPIGKIRSAQLRPILAADKKALAGRVRWVLPRRIGVTRWGIDVAWPIVARAFAETPRVAAMAGLR